MAAADAVSITVRKQLRERPRQRPAHRAGHPSWWPFPVSGDRPHARIRVDALQLDDLVGLAGELAVLSDNLQGLREIPGLIPWLHALEALQRVSRQIRDTTLELRMVPVDELFSRFPRVVRDLADRSGKEIELQDRRSGNAARSHDRRAARRPDGPSDPQCRRPCARDSPGTAGTGKAAGWPDHALGRPRGRSRGDPASRTMAGAWIARRSSRRGSLGHDSRRGRRPMIRGWSA